MEDHTPQSFDSEKISASSATALRELELRAKTALRVSGEQVSRLEAEITAQLDEIAASFAEGRAAESENTAAAERSRTEIGRLTAEWEQSRAAWLAERSALEAHRDELLQQLATLQAEQQTAHDAWNGELAEIEGKLARQQSSWNDQRSEWSNDRAALERERDELRQKFELALQDVQRFRGRSAELEQELVRRPEANQADSAELIALRAERDALSERVDQLERRPATQIDPDTERQLSDLQRRFELAVEDVRELKTKNGELQSQLAAAAKPSARATDGGSMDWESQKRRLLASLEDAGDGKAGSVGSNERATIEGTIEMTDAVVAEKDREIAELKSQLAVAPGGNATASIEVHDRKITELVDADEVIAEHRKRTAQLEREMEEKLRAAELELSIERAKMARQKAELDEWRADLESQRQANQASHQALPSGEPRRRWLSKLGLSSDES